MSPTEGSSSTPRIVALVALVAACALGVFLVATGRSTGGTHSTAGSTVPPSPRTTVASPSLRSLGVVADNEAARQVLGGLDPATLRPTATSTTSAAAPPSTASSSAVTAAMAKRCDAVVPHQGTDRPFGARLAAAQLRVGSIDRLVVVYDLPAAGVKPAVRRILLVDAASCQVLLAVDG